MDRFLKRPADSSSPPPAKKRSTALKRGNETAAIRIAEYGSSEFYADNGSCWRFVLGGKLGISSKLNVVKEMRGGPVAN